MADLGGGVSPTPFFASIQPEIPGNGVLSDVPDLHYKFQWIPSILNNCSEIGYPSLPPSSSIVPTRVAAYQNVLLMIDH